MSSRYPTIPEPTPANLLEVAKQLKEVCELLTGQRGIAEEYGIDERVFRLSKVVDTSIGRLSASISQVESITATADSILAQRTFELEAELTNARDGKPDLAARIIEVDQARVSADEALAQRTTILEAEVIDGRQGQDSLAARITQNDQARVSADEALAQRATTLEAEVSDARQGTPSVVSRLSQIDKARADGDSALAQRATTLEAEIIGARQGKLNLSAKIEELQTAQVDGDNAIATSVQTLSTTVGSNTSSISTLASTTNGLSLRYGVTGYINGVTGGFVFTGLLRNDGAVSYNLEINSNVVINGDLLVNGTITNPKVAAAAIATTNVQPNAISNSGAASGSSSITAYIHARAGSPVFVMCEIGPGVTNDTATLIVNGSFARNTTRVATSYFVGESQFFSTSAVPLFYIFTASSTGTQTITLNCNQPTPPLYMMALELAK